MIRKLTAFIEVKYSLQCSQEPGTEPILILYNIILQSASGCPPKFVSLQILCRNSCIHFPSLPCVLQVQLILSSGFYYSDLVYWRLQFMKLLIRSHSSPHYQTPIQWVPGVLSTGIKLTGREAYYSPLSSAEMKNDGAIPPFLHTWSCRRASLINHMDNFSFHGIFLWYSTQNFILKQTSLGVKTEFHVRPIQEIQL
jgi:hypothetical protein